MSDEPELQKNQSGEWVQYLQQMLAHNGYSQGDTNGELGDELEYAVKQYQSAYGLTADGVVRQDTWDALTGRATHSGGSEHDDEIYLDPGHIPEMVLLLQAHGDLDTHLRSIGIDPARLHDMGQANA
jgi:peptidoglycan hydrolase-like protein with peptidoglycan-binding domain